MDRLAPTRAFIREHLVPLNNIVLLSGSAVAALDFLAPRLSLLPKIVFGTTGAFLAVLLVAAFTPGLPNRAVAGVMRAGEGSALRASPPWQISVALLALITLMGGVSIAKADAGGLIASTSARSARWQSSLLGLESRTAEIKAGTDRANQTLDALTARIGSPSFAGDSCPDIQCAVGMGASKATLEGFLARGARLPVEPHAFGAALDRLSKSRHPARMDTVGIYLSSKALDDVNTRAVVVSQLEPLAREAIAAQMPVAVRVRVQETWGRRGGCDTRGAIRLVELAALNGDRALYDWLVAHGANPGLADRWCQDSSYATTLTAKQLIASTAR